MKRSVLLSIVALVVSPVRAESYDIGSAMESAAFWQSDPVLFVGKHRENGFQFTSEDRTAADSRLEGGVTYHGVPVYESRLAFGEAGGVARVELVLFSNGGTENYREVAAGDGLRVRHRVHVEKSITRAAFFALLEDVRGRQEKCAKAPPVVRDAQREASLRQFSQVWPKTEVPTQTTLTWNYVQQGKRAETFRPGFVRVAVNGPARLAAGADRVASGGRAAAKGAKKIADNLVKDPRGDVFIDNLPMVDQGEKGYCAVATAERVLRYYGLEVDEHEVAQAAGTTVAGTTTRGMKDSVEAIGRKYRLATVVAYGNFDKSTEERIAGLVDEVAVYNKAAKKLRKATIEERAYVHREGNTVFYSPAAVDKAMDPEVLKEMKVNGGQKSKFAKFMVDVRQQINKGIPLFWGVKLGVYPEPGLLQAAGGHIRLIVGYNDRKKEILYSDSWGAGHELKRMPAEWAWTISHCLMYMKPLSK